MHIIPKPWIVRWKVVSMMWVLVCCLDWSFIVMNLQGFWCMQNIWKLYTVWDRIRSVYHVSNMRTISIQRYLITVSVMTFLQKSARWSVSQCRIPVWSSLPERVRQFVKKYFRWVFLRSVVRQRRVLVDTIHRRRKMKWLPHSLMSVTRGHWMRSYGG